MQETQQQVQCTTEPFQRPPLHSALPTHQNVQCKTSLLTATMKNLTNSTSYANMHLLR